jgi:hypothetical protein
MLVESDLFLSATSLAMLKAPDSMLVSRYLPTMDGTGVKLDQSGQVEKMILAAHRKGATDHLHKTVNCYSFSLATWQRYATELERWIDAGRLDDYYEAVLAELIDSDQVHFRGCDISDHDWGEIDTPEDLRRLESKL